MDFAPVKELPGRVRVKLRGPVPEGDVSALEQVVRACPDVTKATVYPRNGEIAISYAADEGAKERVFCHLVGIKAADVEAARELAAYDPDIALFVVAHWDQIVGGIDFHDSADFDTLEVCPGRALRCSVPTGRSLELTA